MKNSKNSASNENKLTGQQKLELRIANLKERSKKEGLNLNETKILANAEEKIDCKSASRVYKVMDALNKTKKGSLLGGSKFPSFKTFKGLLPEGKTLFSAWDGFGVLVKCNKKAAMKSKVDAQGGVIVGNNELLSA